MMADFLLSISPMSFVNRLKLRQGLDLSELLVALRQAGSDYVHVIT